MYTTLTGWRVQMPLRFGGLCVYWGNLLLEVVVFSILSATPLGFVPKPKPSRVYTLWTEALELGLERFDLADQETRWLQILRRSSALFSESAQLGGSA